MLWVCWRVRYQLFPPIFFGTFHYQPSPPHTVPGSIMDSTPQYWDRFFEANECSQAVATPMSKVLLSSNPPDEVDQGEMAPRDLAAGRQRKICWIFSPVFSTKGSGKGLEIWHFFRGYICRCQSKDWNISDSTLDMQICFMIENENYLSVANLENKTLYNIFKYDPRCILNCLSVSDWLRLVWPDSLLMQRYTIHKCQGQNSFYWRWSSRLQ